MNLLRPLQEFAQRNPELKDEDDTLVLGIALYFDDVIVFR